MPKSSLSSQMNYIKGALSTKYSFTSDGKSKLKSKNSIASRNTTEKC